MMEDWTDIIGEELGNISEPLPADDWNVLQQKYAAARRRRKAAVFAWVGGVASAAAAIALALLLIRPSDSSVLEGDLVAGVPEPLPYECPVQTDTAGEEESQPSVLIPVPGPPAAPRHATVKAEPDDVLIADSEGAIQVVKDTADVMEVLVAEVPEVPEGSVELEVSDGLEDEGSVSQSDLSKLEGQVAGVSIRGVSSVVGYGSRPRVSIGLAGGGVLSGARAFAQDMAPPMMDSENMPEAQPPIEDNPEPPVDTTVIGGGSQMGMRLRKERDGYSDSYQHDMPVSFGVSARIMLSKRFSINTGLNYTLYSSMRERSYSSSEVTERERQNVHYLGIPLRCDWLVVNRRYFTFYMGVGAQVDKCVYARVGNERLHENDFLFSLTGAAGLQYNITNKIGLYLEPDFSLRLNEGTLETYRHDHFGVISARAGLRFNF